jgi:hypothetical protein
LSIELKKFPEEIWCMPYVDAMLLWREFEEHPPLRFTFSAFVGYKNPNRKFTGMNAQQFLDAQKMMGPARPLPAHLKDAINWAEEKKKKHPALRTQ